MKILIVDDNEKSLYMLETLLKSCSYDVVSAANGVEALANLREGEIDLIISDILMPQMDGFQLCRECKKDNKLKDIPFVFYTATYTEDKDEEFAMKLGIDRFICKPEEPDKFIEIIQDVISNTVSAKIKPQKAISEEGKEIFKLYSERLVNKLEKKMLDLETEVSERKKYEAKVTHLNLVLRAIRSVNQLIIREKDPEKLIRQACMNLIATRGYSFAWIALLNENNKLKTAAEAGLGKNFTPLAEQMKKGRLNECIKRALKYPGVVLIEETEKNCGDCPLLGMELENSVMTIRLEHEDKIYGVLSVSVLKDFSTESEEQSLFEEIAGDIAFALHDIELEEMRKWTEEELRRTNRALKTISESNQALIHAENEENLLNDICRIIVDSGGYRLTWIGYAEKDEQKTIRPVAKNGYEDEYLKTVNITWADTERGRDPTGTAIRTGNPSIVKNILTDPKFTPWRADAIKLGYVSFMALPLISGDQTYGALNIYAAEPEAFDEEEAKLLLELADDLAYGITTIRVREKHKQAEEELKKERTLLARRVEERTAELSEANAELAKAAKMKDEFLASMSHELRTPLNAILGLSEALQEEVYGEMNQKQHKSLRSIEESGRHLLSLINDILDIAKIEAGKVSLEINQVPIEVVCQASLKLVKQTALKKNLQLTCNNKTSLLTFGADERRLKQILVNLLSNAVKFTPEGGEVGIEVTDDADKEKINFTVWDTGIGIAKESFDKLFQPFIQIDSSLTREYSGTGLGLSLVKHLTELHGGYVTVESEPGEGSRFTITLPVRTETAVPALEAEEGEDKTGKIETGKQQEIIEEKALILLAEDNEKNIEMLSDYLLAKGYNLMIARNGKEAVKTAKERTPDLILMDIQMPGMDGLEATRIIRHDQDEKLSKIPIIALTALVMPGDKEKCLAAGADDYLIKPVGLKKLVKKIEEILGSSG